MAESLIFVPCSSLPLPFHDDLLVALDNGIDPDSPAALVPEYAFDWWNCEANPGLDEKLNFSNINHAMERHSKQHQYTGKPPLPTPPMLPEMERTLPCSNCVIYRDITSSAVSEIEALYQCAEAAETLSQNGWEKDMRRAQGFYTLYQAVLQKEPTTAECTPPSASASAPNIAASTIDGVKVHQKSKRTIVTMQFGLDVDGAADRQGKRCVVPRDG